MINSSQLGLLPVCTLKAYIFFLLVFYPCSSVLLGFSPFHQNTV